MPEIAQLIQINIALAAAEGYTARCQGDKEYGAVVNYAAYAFFHGAAASIYTQIAAEAIGPDFDALRSHCDKEAIESTKHAAHYRKLELNRGTKNDEFVGFDGIRHPRISPD